MVLKEIEQIKDKNYFSCNFYEYGKYSRILAFSCGMGNAQHMFHCGHNLVRANCISFLTAVIELLAAVGFEPTIFRL